MYIDIKWLCILPTELIYGSHNIQVLFPCVAPTDWSLEWRWLRSVLYDQHLCKQFS